jgi:hypothetical protein
VPRAPRRSPAPIPPAPLSDTELESVVAPLLAEVASLRREVAHRRGAPGTGDPAARNRQTVKLVVGVLLGFALIVVAMAVVLRA